MPRPSAGPGANPLAAWAPAPLPVPELLDEADLIASADLTGIGEPHEHSTSPLPRLGEVVRDVERLLAQALAVLGREVDPASEPLAVAWPAISDEIRVHTVLLKHARLGIVTALRKLGKVAALPLPPVGSAVKTTRLDAGEEPTPGSASSIGVAERESRGPVVGAEEGADSGLPPVGVTPVAPGRGVGPGVIGPASMDPGAFARHVRDDAARRSP